VILLMNIIIAPAGFVGIVATRKLSKPDEELGLKNHFVILGIKVVFISAIVSLFCLSTEKTSYFKIFIQQVMNLIVFHFIEAFATQKKLINNRNLIV